QAALNAPGVLAPGINGTRVQFFGNATDGTYLITFLTTTNQSPIGVVGGLGNATNVTITNAAQVGQVSIGNLTLQVGYDTTNPNVATASAVTLDGNAAVFSSLLLAGNITVNVMPGAGG